jgi:hypothetical protein
MAEGPKLEVIKADEKESAPQGYLPGSFVIGSGYDVFGEYCRAASVRRPIIDLGSETKDRDSGLTTFKRITVIRARDGGVDKFEGSTLKTYTEDFSAALNLTGKSGFFKGEVNAAFDTSESRKVSTHFVNYTQRAYFFKLSLPTPTQLMSHFADGAKADFRRAMDPDELVQFYGTHYLASVTVGARCAYSCTVDTEQYESSINLSTAAQLSFQSLTSSAAADLTAEQAKAVASLQTSSQSMARVLGGEPRSANEILRGEFDAWKESVPNNMVFCAMSGDSLVPISKLIDDPKRQAAVDDAIKRAYAANPQPDGPYLVAVNHFHTYGPSRWYYTSDPTNERPPAEFGASSGIPFYAFNRQVEGTVPIYRLSATNPNRYRLSTNKTERSGWSNPEIAFWAYPVDGQNREPVRGFTCDKSRGTSGWHYTTKADVNSWRRDEPATFFAPKL